MNINRLSALASYDSVKTSHKTYEARKTAKTYIIESKDEWGSDFTRRISEEKIGMVNSKWRPDDVKYISFYVWCLDEDVERFKILLQEKILRLAESQLQIAKDVVAQAKKIDWKDEGK